MAKISLDGKIWYGLDKADKPIAIGHPQLMDWANGVGDGEAINRSTAIKLPDGSRLVRGPDMIQLAKYEKWNDIADKLAEQIAADVGG